MPHVFLPHEKLPVNAPSPPSEIYGCGGGLLVTSINATYLLEIYCVELTRDPLAIAEFLVLFDVFHYRFTALCE